MSASQFKVFVLILVLRSWLSSLMKILKNNHVDNIGLFDIGEISLNPFHIITLEQLKNVKKFFQAYSTSFTEIGRGGFSVCIACKSKNNKNLACAKILEKAMILDWVRQDGEYIPVEVGIMKKMSHIPGVIELLTYFDFGVSYIIVSKRHPKSTDMRRYMRENGVLQEKECKRICKTIINIFMVLIAHHYTYFDLKIDNLVVFQKNKELCFRMIDFGSCFYVFDMSKPIDRWNGTEIYIPPEIKLKRFLYVEPAMVYSLGQLCHVMLIGHCAYQGFRFDLKLDLNSFTHLSGPCKDFLSKTLNIREWQRPTFDTLLLHEWLRD